MSIVNCPECKREVSDKAKSCPNCGFGIEEHFKTIENEKVLENQRKADEKREQERIINVKMPVKPKYSLIIIIFGVCALLFFIGIFILPNDFYKNFGAVIGLIIMLGIVSSLIYSSFYYNKYTKYRSDLKMANKNFREYQINVIKGEDAAKERRLREISNRPKCPNCGSSNIKSISTGSRVMSVYMVGLASSKIGKQFECIDCKYKW